MKRGDIFVYNIYGMDGGEKRVRLCGGLWYAHAQQHLLINFFKKKMIIWQLLTF